MNPLNSSTDIPISTHGSSSSNPASTASFYSRTITNPNPSTSALRVLNSHAAPAPTPTFPPLEERVIQNMTPLRELSTHLTETLDNHPAALRFIWQNETLVPADVINRSITTFQQGRGTMGHLREMLSKAGFTDLAQDPLLRDQVPNDTTNLPNLRIGEDPLTRERLTAIIALLHAQLEPTRVATPTSTEEEPDLGNGTWVTSEPSEALEKGLGVAKDYLGSYKEQQLQQKIRHYQEQLLGLDPNSAKAQWLQSLITFYNKAIAYHNKMMGQLLRQNQERKTNLSLFNSLEAPQEAQPDLSSLSKQELTQLDQHAQRSTEWLDSFHLEAIEKINIQPNRIERLIARLEKNQENLERTHAEIEAAIATHPILDPNNPTQAQQSLLRARNFIQAANIQNSELMRLVGARVDQITPPYEQGGGAPVEQDLAIVRADALSDYNHLMARRELLLSQHLQHGATDYLNNAMNSLTALNAAVRAVHPRQEVINLYRSSSELHLEAAAVLRDPNNPLREKIALYLSNAGNARFNEAQERQRENSRQEILNLYRSSSELHLEAAAVLRDPNNAQREKLARYLSNAGSARFNEAQERQRENSRQEILNLYRSSSELHLEAAAVLRDPNNPLREKIALYLSNAGNARFNEAQERQRENPRQEILDLYRSSSELFLEAAAVLRNPNNAQREKLALYLSNAGSARFGEAQGRQRENPRQEIINLYRSASELFLEAAAVLRNPNNAQREKLALYLNNAGHARSGEAQERQRENPRQEIINIYISASELFLEAAAVLRNPNNAQREKLALYLNNAGNAGFGEAQERQRENPRQEIINLYISASELHLEAAAVLRDQNNAQREKLARYLNNAGNARFNEAQERQRENPDQNIISRYRQEADQSEREVRDLL